MPIQLSQIISDHPVFFTLFLIWTFAIKGLALWKAAQLTQKKWFIVLLILNTLGILELIYIFFVARKYEVEVIK